MAIIKNKFPFALENELSLLYLAQIDKLNNKWIPRIIKAYTEDIQRDTHADEILDRFLREGAIYPISEYEKELTLLTQNLNFFSQTVFNSDTSIQAAELSIPFIPVPLTGAVSTSSLKSFTDRNAALIKQIVLENAQKVTTAAELQIIENISQLTEKAITKSQSVRQLSKAIQAATGAIKTKAEFWARDQLKLGYKDIQNARFQETEIPGYIWSTVGDGRVRATHRARHGKFFKEGELSEEPGGPFRCRCVKIPAFNRSQQYSEERIKREVNFMERDEKEQLLRHQAAVAKRRETRAAKAVTLKAKQKAQRVRQLEALRKQKLTKAGKLRKINTRILDNEPLTPQRVLNKTFPSGARGGWVHGSGRRESVLLKRAAKEIFDLKGIDGTGRKFNISQADVDKFKDPTLRLYNQAQKEFKEKGIKEITLYRGLKKTTGENPILTSWTSDIPTARNFAQGRNPDLISKKTIKVEDILSFHDSTLWKNGMFGQQFEYIIMNRKQ